MVHERFRALVAVALCAGPWIFVKSYDVATSSNRFARRVRRPLTRWFSAMIESVEQWFRDEILPYERALVQFLRRKWASADDVEDIRHDIYVRVLQAAEQNRPASPRGFLMAVARNVLIDRARRDRIVSMDLLQDMDELNVLIDEVTPERATAGREQLERLSKVFNQLPGRCREVVWMRRVENLPQKEIASRLGIAEATVEKHLVRGIERLASALYGVAWKETQKEKRSVHQNRAFAEGEAADE